MKKINELWLVVFMALAFFIHIEVLHVNFHSRETPQCLSSELSLAVKL